jgi:hypothetical protein
MSFFGGGVKPQVQSTPVTPRLSDTQLAAKDKAGETRRRRGLNDNILSLGRRASSEQQNASLLGRTAA